MTINIGTQEIVENLITPISPYEEHRLTYEDASGLAEVIDMFETEVNMTSLELNILAAVASTIRYNSWEQPDGTIVEGSYMNLDDVYFIARDIVLAGLDEPFIEMAGKPYGTPNLEKAIELSKGFIIDPFFNANSVNDFGVYKEIVLNVRGASEDLERAQMIAQELGLEGLSYIAELRGTDKSATPFAFLREYTINQLDDIAFDYKETGQIVL